MVNCPRNTTAGCTKGGDRAENRQAGHRSVPPAAAGGDGGRGCGCDDCLRHGDGAGHGQRRRHRRGLHRDARGAGRPHRGDVRRVLPVERRGSRPGPDRDDLAGPLQAPPLCRPGRTRGLRDGGGGCRALGPEGQPARHTALAAPGRRQPLGQGLCRQHRPEFPDEQAAGRRHGERRAGVPVGQDAARPPDHRRGHRSRRGDAQPICPTTSR